MSDAFNPQAMQSTWKRPQAKPEEPKKETPKTAADIAKAGRDLVGRAVTEGRKNERERLLAGPPVQPFILKSAAGGTYADAEKNMLQSEKDVLANLRNQLAQSGISPDQRRAIQAEIESYIKNRALAKPEISQKRMEKDLIGDPRKIERLKQAQAELASMTPEQLAQIGPGGMSMKEIKEKEIRDLLQQGTYNFGGSGIQGKVQEIQDQLASGKLNAADVAGRVQGMLPELFKDYQDVNSVTSQAEALNQILALGSNLPPDVRARVQARQIDLANKSQVMLARQSLAAASANPELRAQAAAIPDTAQRVSPSRDMPVQGPRLGSPAEEVTKVSEPVRQSAGPKQDFTPDVVKEVLEGMEKDEGAPGWNIFDLLEAGFRGYAGDTGETALQRRQRVYREGEERQAAENLAREELEARERERLSEQAFRRELADQERQFKLQQLGLQGLGGLPDFEAYGSSLFD